MKKIILTLSILTLLISPVLMISAQAIPGWDPGEAPPGPGDLPGAIDTANNIVNFMFYALVALTVAFVIAAAFFFLTAAGDTEKTQRARSMVVYAAVAIGVALLARGLATIIIQIMMA